MENKKVSYKEALRKIAEYRRNMPEGLDTAEVAKFIVWDPYKEEIPEEYRDKSKYKTADQCTPTSGWEQWKEAYIAGASLNILNPTAPKSTQKIGVHKDWEWVDASKHWRGNGVDLSKIFEMPGPGQTPESNLVKDIEETFKRCLETIKKKNSDYGETDKDPYRNFRNSESVGVDPARAILVRISDKLSRVSTLLSKEQKVSDESINDTIEDAISYFAILKSYLKNN